MNFAPQLLGIIKYIIDANNLIIISHPKNVVANMLANVLLTASISDFVVSEKNLLFREKKAPWEVHKSPPENPPIADVNIDIIHANLTPIVVVAVSTNNRDIKNPPIYIE